MDINDKIREEIRKRKALNRQKRQLIGEEQERVHQLYLEQKERTQEAVKEAIWAHEKKTKEAREDRNKIF